MRDLIGFLLILAGLMAVVVIITLEVIDKKRRRKGIEQEETAIEDVKDITSIVTPPIHRKKYKPPESEVSFDGGETIVIGYTKNYPITIENKVTEEEFLVGVDPYRKDNGILDIVEGLRIHKEKEENKKRIDDNLKIELQKLMGEYQDEVTKRQL